MANKDNKSLLEKLVPILLVASIALAFAVGVLWQKVGNLESGTVTGTQVPAETTKTTQQQATDKPNVSMEQIKGLFSEDLIKFGDGNSKLIFVQVSDPSCPYCSIASGQNPELNAEAGDRFKLVSDGGTYVSPVTEMKKLVDSGQASYVYIYQNGHGAGEMAQKAMYCAYEMNKFWEVHDLLMTNDGYNLINDTVKNDKNQSKTLADFLASAADSGKLKDCLDSGKYDDRIASEMELARSLGIGGTPGFFVNTTNFAGAYSWTDMQPAVDAVLQ
ncbi:DsbA family protein [Patescibacteria group bacterium]